jgi:hypothetical protein
MSEHQEPDPRDVLTKDEVLLVLDSAMASIATARMFIARHWPEGTALVADPSGGQCPHLNRAPSYPAFCLDCEQEVGVSPTSQGVDGS